MVGLQRLWNAFKNVAIFFSFIINFVFLIVILLLLTAIFQITSGIAEPLLGGLYSSFVGLNQARIITTIDVNDAINVKDQIQVVDAINVKDTIPVVLNIPLRQNTVVSLTQPVPITANASFALPGGGGTIRGSVAITLPQGLQLPVALDLNVPVDSSLPIDLKVPINLNVPVELKVPVALKVPVNIPLAETQLNDVAKSLQDVIGPLTRVVTNLPRNWNEMWIVIGKLLAGQPPDLLADNDFIRNPWPGFRTGPGANLPTFTPTALPPNATVIIVPPAESTPAVPIAAPTATPTVVIPPTVTPVPPTPTLTIIDPAEYRSPTPTVP
jgi:hypothetical protein